jgi:hypothetical protein
MAGGEAVEGIEFDCEGNAVLWSQSGIIYSIDLTANRYRKVGRPGRLALVSLTGCEAGRAVAVLAGAGRARVLLLDTAGEGALLWRLLVDGEGRVEGAARGGGRLALWGEGGASLWLEEARGPPRLVAHLASAAPLAGVRLLSGKGEERAVTVARDGRLAVWGLGASALQLRASAELGAEVKALHLTDTPALYLSTPTGVQEVDLSTLASRRVLAGPLPGPVSHLTVLPGPRAILHTATAALLLGPASGQLELPGPGGGASSPCGALVARLDRGRVALYRVEEAFRPAPPAPEMLALPKLSVPLEKEKPAPVVVAKGARVVAKGAGIPRSPRAARPSTAGLKAREAARRRLEQDRRLDGLDRAALLPILRASGAGFPPAGRAALWARLLHLPRDRRRHKRLLASAPPTAASGQGLLLACYPDLCHLPYLPLFLKPVFEVVFAGHATTGFEAAACLVLDHLLQGRAPAPGPPEDVLALARSLLAREEPGLARHLASIGCSDRQLFWPLLSSGWAVVLPPSDWAVVWDQQVAAGPGLTLALLPATLAALGPTLLACTTTWMVGNLLSSCLALDTSALLATAHSYLARHGPELEPRPGLFSGGLYPALPGRAVLGRLDTNQPDYRAVVRAALAVSPPAVPRLAANKARERELAVAPLPERERQAEREEPVLAALRPRLDPTFLPPTGDLAALLAKAKLLRGGAGLL